MAVDLVEFHRCWGNLEALRSLVLEQIRRDGSRVASTARETTTHFKWLLAFDPSEGTKLWLHDFKPEQERMPGYAATVHNHRYPFTAMALRGGYTNVRYEVMFDPASRLVRRCDRAGADPVEQGCAYAMQPDEYHYLDDIEDGTKTLVLEFPPLLPASFSCDRQGSRMAEHIAPELRLRELIRSQALLATP